MDNQRKSELQAFIKKYGLPLTISSLDQALTHVSYKKMDSFCRSNEILELLGDSVLDLLVIDWLMENHPQGNEGNLTQLRSEIVSNTAIANIGRNIGLHNLIKVGSDTKINNKQIADSIEALFGTLFKLNGFQICQHIFEELFDSALQKIKQKEFKPNLTGKNEFNSKTQLIQFILQKKLPLPKLRLIHMEGPPHQRLFTSQYTINLKSKPIFGIGSAKTKKESEKMAATDLYNKLIKSLKE